MKNKYTQIVGQIVFSVWGFHMKTVIWVIMINQLYNKKKYVKIFSDSDIYSNNKNSNSFFLRCV